MCLFVLFAIANTLFATNNDTKLCLTAIVRNESKIIERCLDSVKDIVDCISICDTGSTDNTVEIIENYLQTHHIPGQVHHHVWENFGHNRTLSVEAAKATLRTLGFSESDTYLLLLDADMTLEVSPDFDKQQLSQAAYLMIQTSSYLSYYNIRLIKASLPWKCVGPTHEYWSCKGDPPTEKIIDLWIYDRGDGGCKADKFERDVRLLTKGLEEEPDNERYMFYLAQSYKDLKQYDEAIKWYEKRIAQGGWREEVWFSIYAVGNIYELTDQWDKALVSYLTAYQFNPSRAEPLERIAFHYRSNGQNNLAYLFAAHGKKIPYPVNETLFIADPVYNYRFDEELSIAAYYTPFREEGLTAIERLIIDKNVPYSVKEIANRNLRFYVQNLKDISFKTLPIEVPLIRKGTDLRYRPTNPSILKTKEGYLAICRCVNYTQSRAETFYMIDPQVEFRIEGRNFLLEYDKDFNVVAQKEILDQLSTPFKFSAGRPIEGLEDCRLFEFNGKLWFTCTVSNMVENYAPQIGLFRLNAEQATQEDTQIHTDYFVLLKGPIRGRCEKNWLPFVKNNELHTFYSYDPLIINQVNIETGFTNEIIHHEQEWNFSDFRGSAGPVPFDGGFLVVIHHVGFDDGRYYFHRFLQLDSDYQITHISSPFTYTHAGVEFCCGMTIDHSGSNLIMTIGVEDREALLATMSLDAIRYLLMPTRPLP